MALSTKFSGTRTAAFAVFLVLSVAAAGTAAWYVGQVLSLASAFYAKTLCSGVFVAGRDADEVVARDVYADRTAGYRRWHGTVMRERNLVTASLYGLVKRRALYRRGLGCTLVTGTSVEALLEQARGFTPPPPPLRSAALWPEGNRVALSETIEGVDGQKLKAALDAAFHEPNPRAKARTRALIVVYKGAIVAERYAPGFGPDTPQLGWSMGKSVLNALIGTLVAEGRLKLDSDRLFPDWLGPDDPRARINIDDLLRMVSGLDFEAPHRRLLSDVQKMLFLEGDSAAIAVAEKLVSPVATSWVYGSGSSILLSSAMRRAIGNQANYFAYPRRALFARIGMNSAVIEPDAAGTFLAPSFVYASARDWARFGLLYLNDGVWNGARILPEGWVKNAQRATAQSGGRYGAHLWRAIPDFLRPAGSPDYKLPQDGFYMLGLDGQMVAVIPSQHLVVVRLGLSRRRGAWGHDALLHNLLKAFAADRK